MLDVIEDILDHVLSDLHVMQKNLYFWQTRAEVSYQCGCMEVNNLSCLIFVLMLVMLTQGSNARKLYFMMFERGPRAFLDGSVKIVREYAAGSSTQHICHSASVYISERIMVLTSLRYSLASFLAQVCL